ncbi:MAG: 4-hydroxy-tetrahydrodipicolinate synthase [Sediminibacterium sp.]|nr:4-hydroxy-tetrahydrodipicolinate synthase [Sediminibacterium sp.]
MIQQKLIGTGVALITPFYENKSIDFTSLEKLINMHLNYTDYIVILGTTAETSTLSFQEKKEIILFTTNIVNKKKPMVVGIGGNNTSQVIEEIQSLPLHNIDAILSVSPYYNKPSQTGIYTHYKTIASSTSLPIILYNVPSRTGKNIASETCLKLATDCKNIIGIKEASGDFEQAMQIIKNKPENFLVISGDDALSLPLIACGMQGVISVIANCFPEKFNQLVKFALANNFVEANKIQHQLLAAYTLLFEENNPAGVKAFMSLMGMIQNNLRLPLVPASNTLITKINTYLANI